MRRTASWSPSRWLEAAAAANGVPLERPQAGRRLAGVENRGARPLDRLDVPRGQRRDAREAAEKVERSPLAGQDRARRAVEPGDGRCALEPLALLDERLDRDVPVEGAEDALGDGNAADDAGLLHEELAAAAGPGRDDAVGREVAVADVLGERCLDDAVEGRR